MKIHRFAISRNIIRDCTAVLFGLAMILPQSFYYGRPMLVLATFILWIIFTLDGRLVITMKKTALPILCLLYFLMVVQLNLRVGNVGYYDIFIAGPIYSILVIIVASHYQVHFPDRLRLIRYWLLVLIAILTVQTIPELIARPYITRMLATNSDNPLIADLYRLGFLGYPQLYALSIPFTTFIVLFSSTKSIFFKHILFISIIIIGSILLLSTLTLVATCFIGGIFVLLVYIFFYTKSFKKKTILYLLPLVLIVSIGPITSLLGSQFEPIEFIIKKGERIFTGVADSGISQGDPTGRGKMFFRSLNTFLETPLFGTGFTNRTCKIGGHSSFMDGWAYFGIIGNFPIFAFQFLLSWVAFLNWRASSRNFYRAAHSISWFIYWLVTVCNSTTFIVLPILLLFVDFMPKYNQKDTSRTYLKGAVAK
ncbi:hypothetical protein [Desulfobacula toluolica]|uniref:Uncharacterized protein n=1 Tax=Desulfobacula toluolica (strain DSM 7467 / Tol2) TaxID=651182 RepID=K0N4E6_DESTT|nr:hypothetical protein [Desulfobacula toluolica]CCK78984.1 uncharacterized protein TOL2_C08160 [Desulfobacula toluolica Tol2]